MGGGDGWTHARRTGTADSNPYGAPRALEESSEAGPLDPLPGMPPGLTVTYRNTDEDIRVFVNYYLSQQGAGGSRLILWSFLLFLMVGLGLLGIALGRGRPESAIGVFTTLEGGALMCLILSWWIRRRLRKQTRGRRTLPISTVVLGPAGMVARDENGRETRLAWSAVSKVDATARHLLLFDVFVPHRVMSAHLIPRRAFTTRAAAEEFLAMARHWHAAARASATVAGAPSLSTDDGVAIRLPDPDPDSDPPLSVTFDRADDDLRRAHRFYLAQQPAQRRTVIGLTLLLAIMGLVHGSLVVSRRITGWAQSALFLPLLFLLTLIGQLWWNRRFRRAETGSVGSAGPITVTIAPSGFAVAHAHVTEMTRGWSGLPGIGSTDDFFVFPRVLVGEKKVIVDAHLIPRRAFATPAAADAFLAAARRWHAAAKGPDDPW